jgi:hypothetical protein
MDSGNEFNHTLKSNEHKTGLQRKLEANGGKSKLLVALFLSAALSISSTGCSNNSNCVDVNQDGRCDNTNGGSGGSGFINGRGTTSSTGGITGSDSGSSGSSQGISSGSRGGIGSSGGSSSS